MRKNGQNELQSTDKETSVPFYRAHSVRELFGTTRSGDALPESNPKDNESHVSMQSSLFTIIIHG